MIALHQAPEDFRGNAYHVKGMVADVWEDHFVAQEQPFGIQRVLRIRLTNREFGTRPVQDLEGNVRQEHSSWLEGYELAAIVSPDTPMPRRGQRVEAEGRFVKVLGYEAKVDIRRDAELGIRRGSDKAYFKLFVTRGFTVVPAGSRYDFTSLKWIFVIASVLGLAVLIRLMYRSDGEADRLRPALRRLRQARPRQEPGSHY